MVNVAKYIVLLENLSFANALPSKQQTTATELPASLVANLRILEKYVPQDVEQQLQQLWEGLQLTADNAPQINTNKTINCYIVRLMHVLQSLMNNINFNSDAKEDLISVAHLKLCIQVTQELAYYALRIQLHEDFYKSPVFQQAQAENLLRCDSSLLLLSVQFFVHPLCIRQLHIANAMELVQRDLLAAIMSLRTDEQLSTEQEVQLNGVLAYLWENESKADYFRHVLLLKATPQLGTPLSKQLHQQLLGKLSLPHGFASLLAALTSSSSNLDATRSADIMANIVAQRGYSAGLQLRLVHQIFDFCQLAPLHSLPAGVLSLRRLCELRVENRARIEQLLMSHWQPLTSPLDLLNGLIVWEQAELCERLHLFQQLFCSSTVACLPSELLVPFMPLLLQLHQQLPAQQLQQQRQQLASLIARCLDNREPVQELPALLLRLYKWDLPAFQALHPRLKIVQTDQVKVQVAAEQQQQLDEKQPACSMLPTLLMAGSDQALTCKVFLSLLSLMLQQLAAAKETSQIRTDLLASETELAEFLQRNYQLKLQLLLGLQQLIGHEPLKAQLATTHSKQFMQLLAEFLAQLDEEPDQMLLLMLLLLLQELLEHNEQLQLAESTQRLRQPLQQLLTKQTDNLLLRNALLPLLELLRGQLCSAPAALASFQQARELIENRDQPHLQVYGIQLMLDALHKKDPSFVSQAPRIMALALSTLRNKESYTFLNCVRLFAALVHIRESEVLDTLSDEYLAETADLDYRLVVGEAIMKAAHEIGPLCYRYKAVLFNCFLHGARSPLNEFRSSAYANLAQLCRLLTYQVHGFFQELLQLIDTELSTGSYVPAKRGALLVLAELLAGMESLLDYQDMLLPIYRLLRVIEAAEACDPQMRQHAANGLKIINEKCRQMLSNVAADQLPRKIQVLGIKDKRKKGKRHILELN
ncbi:transport and Golgi organization protein 6 [Drosophila grimshawi]|uniref:GH10170 n=1 Tax=Drosophila grimshawi TaxID=7222 RepID=B4JBX9_DROGR|nr:transport and Golgi organization protein 6 [Drosophila grimshawi]EDW04082.1 GH10170 [Drosophila grimshawi]